LECSERGQLLQAAVDRQQQLLQQALTACDDVYQGLIASAATQQQQQEAMLSARADVQTLQQDNILLKVRAQRACHSHPVVSTCDRARVFWSHKRSHPSCLAGHI
jgi:cell division FtsZ-interacting protein ZapD